MITPGLVKVWTDRITWYASKAQFLMVAYLFIDKAGWSDWYWLCVPALALIVWIEKNHVIREEQEYYLRKNKALTEMLRKP